jgi:hypothetical protein
LVNYQKFNSEKADTSSSKNKQETIVKKK